ncbi:Gfo/Idh/MocA family oxidoreductase [Actinomycetaceae bacterium MB13-C1-2]|nr:Gfo/Idh/MocA family oxidoreductase [Actinomycetaceae bacterium MB13-C1-2]
MTRTVITYGTYDLFHEGHRRLLERARELGNRLIVGVTSDEYDRSRGKLNVSQELPERIANVQRTGLVDQIIVEEYDGQKIHDIEKWGVDVFAIGSDWLGKFEYLRDYCDVVYLERTRGISSTQLRNDSSGILQIGLAGAGRNAKTLIEEARYVSGVSVESVWSPKLKRAERLALTKELEHVSTSYESLLENVGAVYVSTPLVERASLIRQALESGRHVLAEPPLALTAKETKMLLGLAEKNGVSLVEAVRTAYSPGFLRMVAYARSGSIGKIRSVQAVSTRLMRGGRAQRSPYGGAINELATYPLLAVIKLLGTSYVDVECHILKPEGAEVEQFARIDLTYRDALASVSVGIGVTAEDDLRVSATDGHMYVPAPWWTTDRFETRFENEYRNRRFYVPYEGHGQRYELVELASRVKGSDKVSYKLSDEDVLAVAAIIDQAKDVAITVR